jgi:hypothetical protein
MLRKQCGTVDFRTFQVRNVWIYSITTTSKFRRSSSPLIELREEVAGNGGVLDISVYGNVRLSDVTVSDVLDSDNLPVLFHI